MYQRFFLRSEDAVARFEVGHKPRVELVSRFVGDVLDIQFGAIADEDRLVPATVDFRDLHGDNDAFVLVGVCVLVDALTDHVEADFVESQI